MKQTVRSLASIQLTLLIALLSTAAAEAGGAECSLSKIDITAGMTRTTVEVQVARLLGKPSNYSPYANNLSGGTAEYRHGTCILEVKYRAGAPAPLVANPQGAVQHLSPKDETVIGYKFYDSPSSLERAANGSSAQ
jgi:hypothetical protein